MNPILLKPAGDTRVQVVLQGRVYGSMSASDYYELKQFFFEKALESFARLQAKFDVIVLEGAGSPVELNLKDRDIVNLPFAKRVGAKALLVADIDRGGVFASIVGTFMLLPDEERELLRGFIVNRFRGDLRFFKDGPGLLEKHTQRRCFGVLPFIDSLRVDQEDSLSLDDRSRTKGIFHVGVIRLPHISNYTDFNSLESIPGVAVDYLVEPSTRVDLLIIPGTKNTIRDLRWLRQRGFAEFILDTLEHRGWVLGICGGYQMLGETIADPFAVEEGGTAEGLRLLPIATSLARDKTTVRSAGYSFLGTPVSGYEIHMGRTEALEARPCFITKDDGSTDGMVSDRVGGTYFHGLFDSLEFTRAFLSRVAEARQLFWRPAEITRSRDSEYDRLAAKVREHLDIEAIYDLLQ